ncbi:hypothetical protein GGS20DRAFT_159346 [Poronia punctata]|nr:hypothetical protein GGS20DRAFT_159346 [Poronia punctata]
MLDQDNEAKKKPRRVSFAAPKSSDSGTSRSHISPPTHSSSKSGPKGTSKKDNPAPGTEPTSVPLNTLNNPATAGASDPFISTVTNTPHGLVIDGVLHPRINGHSDLSKAVHPGQPFPNQTNNPSLPPQPYDASQFNTNSYQVNMSTVATGVMPDPNARHYQPPVPDTTYGPFKYTYVPRYDPPAQQYVYPAQGGAAYCAPGAIPFPQVQPQGPLLMHPQVTGAPPGFFHAQPGMATAPIPMAPGCQHPPMQAHPMQAHPMPGPPPGVQPGQMPAMAMPASGPPFMPAGYGQPTPPYTPPAPAFAGGGVEMGKTKAEVDAENQHKAMHNQMNEPQDFKPADDNVSRMYWTRDLDGDWVPRSRYTLDHMGNFRWYVTENGVFYAVMLVE